jgi:hypothetical protein
MDACHRARRITSGLDADRPRAARPACSAGTARSASRNQDDASERDTLREQLERERERSDRAEARADPAETEAQQLRQQDQDRRAQGLIARLRTAWRGAIARCSRRRPSWSSSSKNAAASTNHAPASARPPGMNNSQIQIISRATRAAPAASIARPVLAWPHRASAGQADSPAPDRVAASDARRTD